MRVGLIADVHANLPALEAVLEDMPRVDAIVCAGDVVGYNPWPAACVERVRERATATVRGNHDRTVETPSRYRTNRMAAAGLEYANTTLSATQLSWVRSLPRTARFGDGRYVVVHSHPDAAREDAYVYPDEFHTLEPAIEALEADGGGDGAGDAAGGGEPNSDVAGIVLGHTHVQGSASVGGRLVVNPGSVGQPRDGDPRAAYAVLETDAQTVTLHRVSYDIDRVKAAIADAGLPERTGERLTHGE